MTRTPAEPLADGEMIDRAWKCANLLRLLERGARFDAAPVVKEAAELLAAMSAYNPNDRLREALEELLDTVDGQPLPSEAQADRLENAIWFAVCALRKARGETFNCDGGDVDTALAEAHRVVSEARATLSHKD